MRIASVGFAEAAGVQSLDHAHYWVKIGFKFQSLYKILNISTYDPLFFYANSSTANNYANEAETSLKLIRAVSVFCFSFISDHATRAVERV